MIFIPSYLGARLIYFLKYRFKNIVLPIKMNIDFPLSLIFTVFHFFVLALSIFKSFLKTFFEMRKLNVYGKCHGSGGVKKYLLLCIKYISHKNLAVAKFKINVIMEKIYFLNFFHFSLHIMYTILLFVLR